MFNAVFEVIGKLQGWKAAAKAPTAEATSDPYTILLDDGIFEQIVSKTATFNRQKEGSNAKLCAYEMLSRNLFVRCIKR
jgi:hypothetical protein